MSAFESLFKKLMAKLWYEPLSMKSVFDISYKSKSYVLRGHLKNNFTRSLEKI